MHIDFAGEQNEYFELIYVMSPYLQILLDLKHIQNVPLMDYPYLSVEKKLDGRIQFFAVSHI